jgi:hypothetical protein
LLKNDKVDPCEEFSAAIEALIREAKAKGLLSNDELLIELDDVISLLREGLL